MIVLWFVVPEIYWVMRVRCTQATKGVETYTKFFAFAAIVKMLEHLEPVQLSIR